MPPYLITRNADGTRVYPPPPREFVPRARIYKRGKQWGFDMLRGGFWPLIDQASGPELARRQLRARANVQ